MDGLLAHAALTLASFDAATIYAIGFLVIVVCGLGLPIPEDITLLTMGYMTYLPMPDGSPRPHAELLTAVLVGYAAVMIGDGIMFSMGSRFGMKIVRRRPFRWVIKPARVEAARRVISQHGAKILFAARFMPGIRSVVYFTAGTLGTPYRRFVTFDGIAALFSVPLFIFAGWYWGADIDWAIARARQFEHGVALLILGVTLLFVFKAWWVRRRERTSFSSLQAGSAPNAE